MYENIKSDVLLGSISGGTDIISCFALANPILPVQEGELQSIGLGMDVHALNARATDALRALQSTMLDMKITSSRNRGKRASQSASSQAQVIPPPRPINLSLSDASSGGILHRSPSRT